MGAPHSTKIRTTREDDCELMHTPGVVAKQAGMTWGAKRPCPLPPPLPSSEEWMAITLSAAKAAIRKRRTIVWSQARPRAGGEPLRTPPARRVNLATSAVWSAAAAREPQSRGWDRLAEGIRAVRQTAPWSAVPLSVRLRGFVEWA